MRILWLSNSPHMPTGYGRQTKYICQYLAGDFPRVPNPEPCETYILGLQQIGASVRFGKIKILPVLNDPWAKDATPFWVSFLQPDVFITLMDVWVFPELFEIGKAVTWCPYVPIDSKPLTPRIGEVMKSAKIILPFSDFGVKMLKEYGLSNYFKISHGYDETIYKPLPEERRLQLKKERGLEGKFVVLSVGMNVGFRKGFARLMRAFKLFNDEHKDSVLWLHTDPSMRRGIPLEDIANAVGLEENKNLIYTPNYSHGCPYPENKLNDLYNMADIHVLSTMGEGFGLPIIESMGARCPNIITDFSTTREFIGKEERGLAAKVQAWWTTPLACQQAMVDEEDLASKMKLYYENETLKLKHGGLAEKFAKENYEWSKVLPLWNQLFKKLQEMKE